MYTFSNAANFAATLQAMVASPASSIDPALAGYVTWISDNAVRNIGYLQVEGIDFQGSYNFEVGNLGFWNAGINGTYYLEHLNDTGLGEIIDILDNDDGNPNEPTLKWRAQLGWGAGRSPRQAT